MIQFTVPRVCQLVNNLALVSCLPLYVIKLKSKICINLVDEKKTIYYTKLFLKVYRFKIITNKIIYIYYYQKKNYF